MSTDEPSEPNRIYLTLSDDAKESGLSEIYVEDNTVVVTLKLPKLDPITIRKPIESKKWTIMITLLMREIKSMLSTKAINKMHVNEVTFQLANTLNQDKNYKLIRHVAYGELREKENSIGNDAQAVVKLASRPENTELFFKNQYNEPYVAVRVGKDKHLEIIPLQSNMYERYLIKLFHENTDGQIIGNDTVNKALNLLAANTYFDDKTIPLNIRVAWGRSENRARHDCIYYDMTDSQWRIVEISTDGWRIINGHDTEVPILFKRHNQTPQIEPVSIYNLNIFDQFVHLTNIRNADQKQLLKVYIISLLIPDIDHVILTTYGPKGAAKTFLLELIKRLIDPSKPVLLTLLRNIPEFIQQVNHNYLAFYDNVKYIPYWLSDEICKAVTGIGHTKRKLYTDDIDVVLEHRRCIAINGIDVALTEPDAMDRSLFIKLEEIDDNNKRTKDDLIQEFEKIRPQLLGFIFDILAKAMKIKSTLKLNRLSRMADFTEWGEAISRALGYEDMSFINAYLKNRNEQNIVAIEENIIGRLLVKFYEDYEERNKGSQKFVGSPEEVYRELVSYAERNEISINSKQFPKAANILVKKLNAIISNLKEAYGIIVNISRDKGNNSVITISRRNSNSNLGIEALSKINVINNYYGQFVQRQHIANCENLTAGTPQIAEVTSVISEPPDKLTNVRNSERVNDKPGGTEAPEVTSGMYEPAESKNCEIPHISEESNTEHPSTTSDIGDSDQDG